jgi:hypothetical protein
MSKLILNEIYKCKILKKITEDEIDFLILIDEFNNKHLLESEFYNDYNLEIGKTYNFRVDKINCKGKIFFEPEHPVYKIGECYEFCFYEKHTKINKENQEINLLIYTDNKNTFCEMHAFKYQMEEAYIPEQKITAKVIRTKKARLIIETTDF